MDGLKKVFSIIGVVAGVIMIMIVGIRTFLSSLYDDLPAGKIADIGMMNTLSFMAGIILVLVIVALVWAVRQMRREDFIPINRQPVIDQWSQYQELPDYHAPMPQLPQPRTYTVPVNYHYGVPTPMAETVLRSITEDQETHQEIELTVPLRYLMRFAKCKTPSRDEWTGKPQTFYDAQRFYDAHGFLQASGQTKVWRDEFPLKSRLDWLQDIENQVMGK
jgi:hypothetical protein